MRSSSAGAEMLADKEKSAENTLCILKGFDAVWGHFRPAEPRVPLSIDAKEYYYEHFIHQRQSQ